MPSSEARDYNALMGPTKRMATGKKKPARKTGAMGTPRKKATKRPARKSKKK